MRDAVNPLQQLDACGQSPWIDHLSRAFSGGGLNTLVEQDGVKGVTSNPSIFENAIADRTMRTIEVRCRRPAMP